MHTDMSISVSEKSLLAIPNAMYVCNANVVQLVISHPIRMLSCHPFNLRCAYVAAERNLRLSQRRVDLDDEHVLGLVERANWIALVVSAESDARSPNPAAHQFAGCFETHNAN